MDASSQSPYLKVFEAARYLRRSRTWIYENLHRLPHVRLNVDDDKRGIVFDVRELDAWLDARRVPARGTK
jgi:hypothetical protein